MRATLGCGLCLVAAVAAAAPPAVDEPLRAGARATLVGDWDRALRTLRAAAGRSREGGDAARLAVEIARVVIERHFYHAQDRAAAERAADEALAVAGRAADERLLGAATLQRARLAYTRAREDGSWAEATAIASRAHQLSAQAGDRLGVGQAEYLLGIIEQMQDKLDPAAERFTVALRIAVDLGDVDLQSNANRHLGFVFQERQDWARAARYFELSLLQRETMGSTVTVPFAAATLAGLEWSQLDRRDAALARLERAIPIASKARSTRAEAQTRLMLGRWLLERGQRDAAAAQARAAKLAATRFGSKPLGEEADKLLVEARRR